MILRKKDLSHELKNSTINFKGSHNYIKSHLCSTAKGGTFNYDSLLANLDLIKKYNLKSYFVIPKIKKKFAITFPLQSFLEEFAVNNKNRLNEDLQIKSAFLLYLLLSNLPYKIRKKLKKMKSEIFPGKKVSLEITLTKKHILQLFLYQLFFENKQEIAELKFFKNIVDTIPLENIGNTELHRIQDCYTYKTKVLREKFKEINFFSKSPSLPSNSKEFYLNLRSSLKTKMAKDSDFMTFLQNVSPFWGAKKKRKRFGDPTKELSLIGTFLTKKKKRSEKKV